MVKMDPSAFVVSEHSALHDFVSKAFQACYFEW